MNKTWKGATVTLTKKDDIVYELLKMRGIDDPDEFLRITKKKLHNPYKMKDLKKAVVRIIEAIEKKQAIGIIGDYDCDGVSSTSLWLLVLKELGVEPSYFIPDRFKDGYGVGKRGIDYMIDQGVDLLITCDTGITAIGQVKTLVDAGIDVIVTDHHEPQRTENFPSHLHTMGHVIDDYLIPKCTAVVNIKRPDDKYPFKSLAGVGVSFKILCAVCEKLHPAQRAGAYQFMDIVTLGTIADMMEIVDENRIICAYGLRMLSNTKNRGIYQLIRANNLNDKEITSMDVGWTLAPCINAAGRIVSAEQAVEMIISENRLDAYRYAKQLVEINTQRKELTKQFASDIIRQIQRDQQQNPTNIIVLHIPDIPEGIVGLLAGRIMNHFYKPVILFTDSEEVGKIKGSGRSISALNMFQMLLNCTDMLDNFGGHDAACGLSMAFDKLDGFRESLEAYTDMMLSERDLQPSIYIDSIVKGDIIDVDFVKDLQRLEPYGSGNLKPLFMMTKLRVIKHNFVGADKDHLWALLSDGKKTFASIGFFLAEKYKELNEPRLLDIAFYPDLNEYPKGKINVQLKLEDFRKAVK